MTAITGTKTLAVAALAVVLCTAVVYVQTTGTAGSDAGATTGPAVDPSAVITIAANVPPLHAKPVTSIGEGGVHMNTAGRMWVQYVDVDWNGHIEKTDLLFDDENKMLVAYSNTTFACRNGGTGDGGLLIAVNAEDNLRDRPEGSGFWVAGLEPGECGVPASGLWGCQFDKKGMATACGMATIDDQTADITIVTPNR
jgi:hypothetical protein